MSLYIYIREAVVGTSKYELPLPRSRLASCHIARIRNGFCALRLLEGEECNMARNKQPSWLLSEAQS